MKLKPLRTKRQTPEGYCRMQGCEEPSTCFWRNKPVCTRHWFFLRTQERRRFLVKKQQQQKKEKQNV